MISPANLKPAANYLALFLLAVLIISCAQSDLPAPPLTEIVPVVDTLHGHEITDNYRWLEDQQSPETRTWIDRQNSYTLAVFERLPMMDKLENRLSELMHIDKITTPRETGRNRRTLFSLPTGSRPGPLGTLYARLTQRRGYCAD
ncbi:MAG: hypothetical protein P1R58_07215 [bacterium]|nr:hypothetical protein [bacterium]